MPPGERDREGVIAGRVDRREPPRRAQQLHQQAAVLGGDPAGGVEDRGPCLPVHVRDAEPVSDNGHATSRQRLDPALAAKTVRLEVLGDVAGRDLVPERRQGVVELRLVVRVRVELDAAVLTRGEDRVRGAAGEVDPGAARHRRPRRPMRPPQPAPSTSSSPSDPIGYVSMHANGSVVVASEITRRYGEGDTAVDALRGISLEVARGQLTTVMGPSGLGQVDAHAHPRRARPADLGQRRDRRHGDHDARRHRPDQAPPRAHRVHLPVLQPAADAHRRGERPPAADDRRREARQGLVRGAADERRPAGPPQAPARPSSPAASSSASRSRARSSRSRRSSSPTSRPATSTRRPAARSSS